MSDTLKWLYRLINTFIEGSSAVFNFLQLNFKEAVALVNGDDPFGKLIQEVLGFFIDTLGLGNLTFMTLIYGASFGSFLLLMLVRWVRGLMLF